MTDAIQKPIAVSLGEPKAWTSYSLDGAAELQRADRHAGREYLPMDVFVDVRTMRRHFQGSPLRARSTKVCVAST